VDACERVRRRRVAFHVRGCAFKLPTCNLVIVVITTPRKASHVTNSHHHRLPLLRRVNGAHQQGRSQSALVRAPHYRPRRRLLMPRHAARKDRHVMEKFIVFVFVLVALGAIVLVIPVAVDLVWPGVVLGAGIWIAYLLILAKERTR